MSDVEDVVATIRSSFASGLTRPLSWRRAQLRALLALLEDNQQEIEDALADDLGKPAFEAYLSDIASTRREIKTALRGVRRWSRSRRARLPWVLRPARAKTVREPLGVVVVIAPWNYPVNLTLVPLASALAAGNCVVIKPSELAPATSSLLARLIPHHLDARAVAVTEGDGEVARRVIDAGVDHVFFTGGIRAGKAVLATAAPHLTPVTLELGGKNAAIVSADANIAVAASRLAWGKFLNAGQTCIAPDFILADRAIADELVAELSAALDRFYGDDPRSSSDYARIINVEHVDRLTRLISASGGTVERGGVSDRDERYVAPTILIGVDRASPIMSEEIFGPVLPVVISEGLDDALGFVASLPSPLVTYLFSRSSAAKRRARVATRSGALVINTTLEHFAASSLPFGGLGSSGFGRYHGRYGFETFTHLRPVYTKPTRPALTFVAPPYTGSIKRFVRRLL